MPLASIRAYCDEVGQSDVDPGYRREGWVYELVPVEELRTMYDDFRGFKEFSKHERFAAIGERHRDKITNRSFPRADQICVGSKSMPTLLVLRTRENGLYVLEGSKRTFIAWWQGVSEVPAFVLGVDDERSQP